MNVWYVDLDAVQDQRSCGLVLSEDEWERANRFRLQLHRDRFVACRAALRWILAGEAGADPKTIRFQYGPCGKPELDGNPFDVRFNLSHAEDRAVIAVCRHFDLGVDIEPLRSVTDCDGLARLVFSELELDQLARADDTNRAFLNGWTRKEAYIKALGTGLSEPLRCFSVSLVDRGGLVAASPNGGQVSDWTLVDLEHPGYVAALAARVPGARVHVHAAFLPPSRSLPVDGS